jgi:hypothetical protein
VRSAPALEGPEGVLAVASLLGRQGREVEARIDGDSMGVTLPDGCRVRIRLGEQSHAVGDLVAFTAGRTLVAHRVVQRSAGYLVTRGDARTLPDPPVALQSVLGSVTAVEISGQWGPPGTPPRPQFLAMAALAALRVLLAVNPVLAQRVASALMAGSAWLQGRGRTATGSGLGAGAKAAAWRRAAYKENAAAQCRKAKSRQTARKSS